MSKTLYLSPPSFDGFDGGAGARYQARREVTSYWYPTWLAQPAALTPNSKLMDCPPHNIDMPKCLAEAKNFDHVIINTSTPSLKNDCKVADAFNVSVGSTIVCAPTKPIFVSGFCDLMASATLQSFFNDGVLVLMMTWSKFFASARHLGMSMLCGGQSINLEFGVSAAGCASQVGYQ